MPEEHQDDPEGREPRMEDLLRSQREILARLDKLAEASPLPKPKQEEPLAATVRRLKWMRTDLDSLIAHFDALLAAWQRQHASGDVATLPELTRRVKDLEARLQRLEGPGRPAAGRAEGSLRSCRDAGHLQPCQLRIGSSEELSPPFHYQPCGIRYSYGRANGSRNLFRLYLTLVLSQYRAY